MPLLDSHALMCALPQVSFSAPMEGCASPRLRCVTGGRSARIGPTRGAVAGPPRAASFTALAGRAAFHQSFCATERETAPTAQMSSAAVRSVAAASLSRWTFVSTSKDCFSFSVQTGSTPPAASCIGPSFLCPESSKCVSQHQLCDGRRDCPDGADESNCAVACENQGTWFSTNRRRSAW